MKYKTKIEIVTEAENKADAMEMVGEYLSGDLVSGIEMKCSTAPLRPYNRTVVSAVVMVCLVAVGIFSYAIVKGHHTITGASDPLSGPSYATSIVGIRGVQPPLRTSSAKDDAAFKKAWEETKAAETLNYIKRIK